MLVYKIIQQSNGGSRPLCGGPAARHIFFRNLRRGRTPYLFIVFIAFLFL
jgi:hypothetical protein